MVGIGTLAKSETRIVGGGKLSVLWLVALGIHPIVARVHRC